MMLARFPTNINKWVGQSAISGWGEGEHDVRISVPFTRDTTRPRTQTVQNCLVKRWEH